MCEVLDEQKLAEPKKEGLLKKIGKTFDKKENPFTAESCFIQSKYGEGAYKKPEDRIKDKQDHIRSVIRSKFAPSMGMAVPNYSSYHAVVDIEEDLTKYVDQVFKPFLEGGFEIINLTKECKSVIDNGIYLISWRNAFNEQP